MLSYIDDFEDIEYDDNEIINRIIREMALEERRQLTGVRAGPGRKRQPSFDDDDDFDDFDDEYDEFDDFDDDDDDDDDDDFDDDRY